jgi:hypothetical protein
VKQTQKDENVGDRIRGQENDCPTSMNMVDLHTVVYKARRNNKL